MEATLGAVNEIDLASDVVSEAVRTAECERDDGRLRLQLVDEFIAGTLRTPAVARFGISLRPPGSAPLECGVAQSSAIIGLE